MLRTQLLAAPTTRAVIRLLLLLQLRHVLLLNRGIPIPLEELVDETEVCVLFFFLHSLIPQTQTQGAEYNTIDLTLVQERDLRFVSFIN